MGALLPRYPSLKKKEAFSAQLLKQIRSKFKRNSLGL